MEEKKTETSNIPEHKLDTEWQVRRENILRRREKEEKKRNAWIRKARGLETSWRLTNLCREFIKENSNTWQELDDKREEERRETEREEQRAKAKNKKEQFLKKREKEQKIRRITEMLQEIPKTDKERIESEVRKNRRGL